MKALLYKDIYNLRFSFILFGSSYLLYFILTLLLGFLIPELNENYWLIYFLLILGETYIGNILFTSFQIDHSSNWEQFIISNGIERRNIINSKYLLGILASLIISIFPIIALISLNYGQNYSFFDAINLFLIFNGTNYIIISLIILILNKFDSSIANFLYILVSGLAFAIIISLYHVFYLFMHGNTISLMMCAGIFIVFSLIALGLYKLNIKFYNKKEF